MPKLRRVIALGLLIPLLIASAAGRGGAEEVTVFPATSKELSFQLGYGITHRGFGQTRTQVQTVDFIGRYGYFLSDELGDGWYRGQFEHVLELPLHLVVDPRTRIMTGGNVLAKWNFNGLMSEGVIPYVFAGGGILYVDLGLRTMGSKLDFSYGGGTGIQYFLKKDMALSTEYRYHHISNASTAQPNEPLNSSKILIGISVFR